MEILSGGVCVTAIIFIGHGALGIGHWALGVGRGALGMGHGAWGIGYQSLVLREREQPLQELYWSLVIYEGQMTNDK
ncbi:MAG: hypothetical protein RM049_03660 [Nostoc sp. DedQUE04]|nr:hypothetical protein [Nostoc sp. DedQUE04]